MSYAKAKAKYSEDKNDAPQEHSKFCHASGCPLHGSVSIENSRFMCWYHASSDPDRWQQITTILQDAEDIRIAIKEVLHIDTISWSVSISGYPPKWQEFEAFFSDKPHLQPNEIEKTKKRKYEYRLRDTLRVMTEKALPTLQVPKREPVQPYNELPETF